MAVGRGAAVTGQMLEHRQHAALAEPVGNRAGDRRNLVGALAIGAIPDHRIGAGDRHIGERQAIHVDPERREVAGDQARAQARRLQRRSGVAVLDPPIVRAGRIARPMRRAEALHAAAFLIDQNGRIGAADRLAKIRDETRALGSGVSTLRLNRMRPHGSASRRNDRSWRVKRCPRRR